ncbi:hypothetical protein F511_15304 [Dorcoceras hygrometricum]|uniref:Rab-GAP TBC domain-containing protein n=1 Tax=Dorcoceras hygrometricum TaxID=472368 RepID=A0A2Z7ALJ2_9LAMI|nr:hypothetical protein F511_15304 [Dorcoceras hygrometricum]
MNETEVHDLSDDADYATSIQQSSGMMRRSDSGKRSSSSDLDGAEIVYTKDNVAVHPTQYASERISGRLKLIKQENSLFMTWIPYKGQSSSSRLSEKDKNLYTIRALPFSDVRSIRRHTPTLGWQYVIVVMSSGLAFPPLYFYNGGVREFIATAKQHIVLVRSAEDGNVFLVNDFQNPLQRTLSSLELPMAVSGSNVPCTSLPASELPSNAHQENDVSVGSSERFQQNGRQQQKHHDPTRDLSIQILEKFSLVTRFARETTSQIFRDSDGFSINEGEKLDQSVPDHHPITASNESGKVPVASDPLELDKLSLAWGKPRQPPLGHEEWTTFLDSEGRVMDSQSLRKRIFYGGVEHNMRKEVWTILLGYHAYDSTYAEREYLTTIKKTEYETIKKQWQAKVRTDRSFSFYDGDENPNVYLLRDILLTYSFYNFDLGYCQGMSDLLSPILFVMGDESESFWCFVSLMERLGPNFNRDQSGMHSQLFALSKLVELLDSPLHNYFAQNDCLNYFFCFRWILIQFKREFEYEKTMQLWEVLWTHHPSEHLHLYVCVAILKRHRAKIMGEKMDFDTLLKFINELSDHIDLDATLRDAEALCLHAGENGAASIPPGTPPSLPLEDASIYPQPDDDIL